MSEDRKPSEDLKEGLGLIYRAARSAAKQVDVAKIDKGLDRAVTEVGRVVSRVGRVVADEVNRMAASPPPWSKSEPVKPEEPGAAPNPDAGEGEVQASAPPDPPPPQGESAADPGQTSKP